MQIYNTSDPSVSIIHHAWRLCDADINSYPLNDIVREINAGYEELAGEIIVADGTWQFDDTNYTDLPIGLGNLVEGQQDYTFTSEYLAIEAIEILTTNNVYKRIKPLDHRELNGMSTDEYFGVDASGNPNKGFPEYFDVLGDTISLFPAPGASNGVTLANGMQVFFKRTVDTFTTSDTTQQPAFPSTYHHILAYYAAIPFCVSYKKDRVAFYEKRRDEIKRSLLAFYGLREKSRRHIMSVDEPLYK